MLIFGFNRMGKLCADVLLAKGETVEAFLDSASEAQGREYLGIRCVSPNAYKGTDKRVITTATLHIESMIRDAMALGMTNFVSYLDVYDASGLPLDQIAAFEIQQRDFRAAIKAISTGKKMLASVDLVITEVCTLRCKDCANLMQYFDKPTSENFDNQVAAFDKLYSLYSSIGELRLIGGDAMAARRLPDYLRHLATLPNIISIIIYTNGIIIPDAELLECLTDGRISFCASDYGLPAQKLDQVATVLQAHNTRLSITRVDEWQDCAKIQPRNRSSEELRDIMRQCCARDTLSLKNAKLWRCPLAGSLASLRAVPEHVNQYVDLLTDVPDDELLRRIEMLMNAEYLQVCDYCGGRPTFNDNPIPVAVQTKKPLPIKRYEQPMLSFIVPVFDRAETLPAAVDSVLAAGQEDVQIVLVDDCSTDGSWKCCQAYAAKYNNITILQTPRNIGPGGARNLGIEAADGKYLFFLDSDDYIDSALLPALIEICAYGDDIVAFNTMTHYKTFTRTPAPMHTQTHAQLSPDEYLAKNGKAISTQLWCYAFKRELIMANAIRMPAWYVREDSYFTLWAFAKAASFSVLSETIYHYNKSSPIKNSLSFDAALSPESREGLVSILDLTKRLYKQATIASVKDALANMYKYNLWLLLLCTGYESTSYGAIIKQANLSDLMPMQDDTACDAPFYIAPATRQGVNLMNLLSQLGMENCAGFMDNNPSSDSNAYVKIVEQAGYNVSHPNLFRNKGVKVLVNAPNIETSAAIASQLIDLGCRVMILPTNAFGVFARHLLDA